jgi:predicted permease
MRERSDGNRTEERRIMQGLLEDLRYAARRLAQSPGFTLAAALTLSLGVGANAAIFQLLDAVRLRSLPVSSSEELVELRVRNPTRVRGNFSVWRAGATYALWEEIQKQKQPFSGVLAWSGSGMRLGGSDSDPRFVSALLVSGGFFDVLGVRPALGRLLTPADDVKGCATPSVVLSEAFWRSEFGGDASVLGRAIELGRARFSVVGVVAARFSGLEVGRKFDVALPLCAEALPAGSASRLDPGVDWWLIVMGRLRAGWTLERASAHLEAASPAIFDASLPPNYPAEDVKHYREFKLAALPASGGVSLVREQYTGSLLFLQATAALVLLIGCANLANLMLARGASRAREMSVRLALGAERGRLVRLLLAESLLLCVAGTLGGVWLADALSSLVTSFVGAGQSWLFLDLRLDWRLLGFACLAAILTCALFGLVPAFRAASVSPESALRASGRGATEAGGRFGLRQLLVVSQVGLSLVLLFGSLLFARTLGNLTRQDLGLRPQGVTIAYVDFSGLNLPVERRPAFRRELLERVRSAPGVLSASHTSVVPLSGGSTTNDVWPDGRESARATSYLTGAGSGYFRVLEIAMLSGRDFDDARDTPSTPRVAIVNEAFARRFFGGASPVGKRIWREAISSAPERDYEIVGLVEDAKYEHLRQGFEPTVYLPISQATRPGQFAQLLIRTSVPSESAVAMLKTALQQLGGRIVPTFQAYDEMLDGLLARDRLVAGLSWFFGLLAVLLASLGLFGLTSFAVARRTKEIGIRSALGADAPRILRMILGEASLLITLGCAAGVTLSLALGHTVKTLVYGVEPTDPLTLAGASLLLVLVALVASVLPARRAARLDPMAALRLE